MSSMNLTFGGGWDNVEPQFKNLLEMFEGESLLDIEEKGAEVIAVKAREEYVPVDTGELQNSIEVRRDGGAVLVGAGTDHAIPVEFGTSKMEAQPFLRPASENHTLEVEEAMKAEAIKKASEFTED